MSHKTVDEYLEVQASPQREICQQLRKILFKTFPKIQEAMKWGVPSYASGRYYFVALKDHVNFGFSIKGFTKEEISQFQGSGKTMRVIEISTLEEIDESRIVAVLKQVEERHHV